MSRSPRRAFALLGLCAALALPLGCLAPGTRGDAAAEPRASVDRYRLESGEARSVAGCRYAYRVYEPTAAGTAAAGATPPTVLLGHGFLRDQDTLIDLARALADVGVRVATLNFCNMRPWNGHHARNASDLRALAERVAADAPRVYGGFSAGALAAALAARDDPATLGVLALDLVDQDGIGRAALAASDAPLVGLQGEPSACNAGGSGARAFAERPDATLETVTGASHCEFESPTDRLCELLCGDGDDTAADERQRAEIVRRALAAVLGFADAAREEASGERDGDERGNDVLVAPAL